MKRLNYITTTKIDTLVQRAVINAVDKNCKDTLPAIISHCTECIVHLLNTSKDPFIEIKPEDE